MMFPLIHSSSGVIVFSPSPLRASDCTIHTIKYRRIKQKPPEKPIESLIIDK